MTIGLPDPDLTELDFGRSKNQVKSHTRQAFRSGFVINAVKQKPHQKIPNFQPIDYGASHGEI